LHMDGLIPDGQGQPKKGACTWMCLCCEAMDRYIAPAISAYTPSMAKMATSCIYTDNTLIKQKGYLN